MVSTYSLSTNDLMILAEHMYSVGKQIVDDDRISDRDLGYQLRNLASRLQTFVLTRVDAKPEVLEILSIALRRTLD